MAMHYRPHMLCTACCACDDASWTLYRCYKTIHNNGTCCLLLGKGASTKAVVAYAEKEQQRRVNGRGTLMTME